MAKHTSGLFFPVAAFLVGVMFAACSGADNQDQVCDPNATGASTSGSGMGGADGGTTGGGGDLPAGGGDEESANADNNFHHPNDAITPGQKDPFEILAERADEGPVEIRSRMHSCTRLPYTSLGSFLASRGVNMANPAVGSAADLYKKGGDALGIAKYDVRQGEASFYTISAAAKVFDIFTQAAAEIIANIENADACKLNGQGKPMFDATTGKCVYTSLSCLMGRPASQEDMDLCNLMISQADPNSPADIANKRKIAVAAFLSAAHTCE